MARIAASVLQAWRKSESESIGLIVKAKVDRAELQRRVQAALQGLVVVDPDYVDLGVVSLQVIPQGPGLWISKCEEQAFEPLLAVIARSLDEQGLAEAELAPMAVVKPLGHRFDDLAFLLCLFSLRGRWSEPYVPEHGRVERQDWLVDEADVEVSTRFLFDWALGLPGAEEFVQLATGPVYNLVPAAQAWEFGWTARSSRLKMIVPAGDQFRFIDVTGDGGFVAAGEGTLRGIDFDWAGALERTTGLLAEAGDFCDYGHLTRGQHIHQMGAVTFHADRIVSAPWTSSSDQARETLASGQLFDAYGVMRLPGSQVSGLQMDSIWHTEPVADPSMRLLVADESQRWFGQRTIDPDILTAARSQFAGRIEPHWQEQTFEELALLRRR